MNRYRIFKRSNGIYFLEDKETRKQESLKTRDRSQAFSLWTARNQASLQPYLNQTMAKAYLSAKLPRSLDQDVGGGHAKHRRRLSRRDAQAVGEIHEKRAFE